MNTGKCKSCGASIIWAKTINGKSIPLNADPVDFGNVALINGVAHVLGPSKKNDPGFATTNRYHSHFGTCPNSVFHRKKK